eukprot:snap_masked-scaffold_5-processed-gene-14.19-mRNA-1 protein AED:1.00 eAED:1.00 QI:0/-1/0/0/-1/1/1/0/125
MEYKRKKQCRYQESVEKHCSTQEGRYLCKNIRRLLESCGNEKFKEVERIEEHKEEEQQSIDSQLNDFDSPFESFQNFFNRFDPFSDSENLRKEPFSGFFQTDKDPIFQFRDQYPPHAFQEETDEV